MRKRLAAQRGETLTETLVSLLIGAMALVMLPGALVASAKVNAEAEKQSATVYSSMEAVSAVQDTVHFTAMASEDGVDIFDWVDTYSPITVTVYEDGAGLRYYR